MIVTKQIRIFFATIKARILWKRLVKTADKAHRLHPQHLSYCVIPSIIMGREFLVVNRNDWKEIRHELHLKSDVWNFGSVKEGSWYFTPGKGERNPMNPVDIEARRRVFIKSRVRV